MSLIDLQESYDRAKHILQSHSKELKLLADALLEYETLETKEIDQVIKGQSLSLTKPKLVKQSKTSTEKSSNSDKASVQLVPAA
jgi:hypothetical protein